ncbi:hypothetical protein NPIL_100201, partial [Nephila pilipes]
DQRSVVPVAVEPDQGVRKRKVNEKDPSDEYRTEIMSTGLKARTWCLKDCRNSRAFALGNDP